jgi:hypothetical protein
MRLFNWSRRKSQTDSTKDAEISSGAQGPLEDANYPEQIEAHEGTSSALVRLGV